MDVLTLSRLQFRKQFRFLDIIPAASIGLGVVLVIFEALWLKTKNRSTTSWRGRTPKCGSAMKTCPAVAPSEGGSSPSSSATRPR